MAGLVPAQEHTKLGRLHRHCTRVGLNRMFGGATLAKGCLKSSCAFRRRRTDGGDLSARRRRANWRAGLATNFRLFAQSRPEADGLGRSSAARFGKFLGPTTRALLLIRTAIQILSSRAHSPYQLLHLLPFVLQTRTIDPRWLFSMTQLRQSPGVSH